MKSTSSATSNEKNIRNIKKGNGISVAMYPFHTGDFSFEIPFRKSSHEAAYRLGLLHACTLHVAPSFEMKFCQIKHFQCERGLTPVCPSVSLSRIAYRLTRTDSSGGSTDAATVYVAA